PASEEGEKEIIAVRTERRGMVLMAWGTIQAEGNLRRQRGKAGNVRFTIGPGPLRNNDLPKDGSALIHRRRRQGPQVTLAGASHHEVVFVRLRRSDGGFGPKEAGSGHRYHSQKKREPTEGQETNDREHGPDGQNRPGQGH